MNSKCFICEKTITPFDWQIGVIINCPLCGEYEPSEYFLQKIYENGLQNRHLLSGAIRENYEKGIIFKVNKAQDLLDSVVIPKNPLAAIDRLLLYVAQKGLSNRGVVALKIGSDYSLVYAESDVGLSYIIQLARELNYFYHLGSAYSCRVAAKGWERIGQISKDIVNSNQAFVAMWFSPELKEAWENGLRPALVQTGYDPMRIDLSEHNEKIDDRIIAEIRKSGLLVADFTGQRGGVYFEAGFALGLGLPVIWTCRDTDIGQLHFDTRQYNHIVWNDAEELRVKLINRIEATLPNRPKAKLTR